MTPLLRKLLSINWVLFALILGLAIFGIIAIYSATHMRADPNVANFWRRQAMWVGIGAVVFLITSLIHYRWIEWGALPMYAAGIALLILTMFIGVRVDGAKRWLNLGPMNFQPSQLAFIAAIMVLALFLNQFRNLHPMLKLGACGAIVGGPAFLILAQPDLGSTIVWFPVLMVMLFTAGMPMRYLASIMILVLAIIPVFLNLGLKPYQRARITAFLNPDIDPQGAAWAINQSLIAIGSGGWGGKGFKAANTQIEMGFVPSTAIHNDYIFTAIGEQWGFVGGTALLCAFALLLLTCIYIAAKSADNLGVLICAGIGALLFTHIFQNVGMTVALLPITGLPLPLISYSGSFIIMVMFGLGVVNSVWVHRKVTR